ncbi:MAG: hypothetical protein AAF362_02765 [Pseudomonadota bacterium]
MFDLEINSSWRAGNAGNTAARGSTQFFKRFRFIGPAIAAIAIFLFVMGVVQVQAYTLLFPYYDLLDPGPLRNLIATGFILTFGYIRLLMTVYILTHAIRASYRHSSD